MITKKKDIKFKVYIYAKPSCPFSGPESPYEYEACTIEPVVMASAFKDTVLVEGPLEMTATVPEGVDIVKGVVQNLEKEKEEKINKCNAEVTRIDEMIQSVMALPSPESIDG